MNSSEMGNIDAWKQEIGQNEAKNEIEKAHP
jgi:hypothetical protein